MSHYTVGDIEVTVAVHGRGSGSPRWLFPEIGAEDLAAATAPYRNAHGDIEFVYSSLIVISGDRVALLDAGPAPPPGSDRSSVLSALDSAGLGPGDVGVVVVSHGHDDHIGGLTRTVQGEPRIAFPDATHYVGGAEVDHWVRGPGGGALAARTLALLEREVALRRVDGEVEVLPGVTVLPAPGHTPGHLSVQLSSQGRHALYVGDALAHQVNVPHPDWNHFSDMLPGPARASRRRLVQRAAAGGHLVLASHIPVAGRVRSGGLRTFVPETPGHWWLDAGRAG